MSDNIRVLFSLSNEPCHFPFDVFRLLRLYILLYDEVDLKIITL